MSTTILESVAANLLLCKHAKILDLPQFLGHTQEVQWVMKAGLRVKAVHSWLGSVPFKIMDECCCSDAKLCLTLCDPMDCSTPGLPILH